jgi:DNA-binding PadR family transcriptional regulator
MRRCEEEGGGGPGCGGGGFGPGSGRGRGRGALLEPAVLAALAEQTAHGYDLRRAVEEMTEGIVVVDPGGLYRLLRQLEMEGVVVSAWTEGAFGPQRREYRLTAAGWELLVHWGEDLARRERAFHSVSAAIRRSLGRVEQEENGAVLETGPDPRGKADV